MGTHAVSTLAGAPDMIGHEWPQNAILRLQSIDI